MLQSRDITDVSRKYLEDFPKPGKAQQNTARFYIQ